METLDEILVAFEEALELERELGTRTVECDRALLSPLPISNPPATNRPITNHQLPVTQPTLVPNQEPGTKNQEPSKDFAFIARQLPQGAAAELLAKMVAAMGYTMEQVSVVAAADAVAAKPAARVYVVLGSDAFSVFAPGQRAALGLWCEVADVPTVVTYSPARILSYFGNDADGLTKAKRQIWSDLKSALARLGKKPPR